MLLLKGRSIEDTNNQKGENEMKTIELYTPQELKEANPKGFEKAHQNYNYEDTEIPWQSEIVDSLKAIIKESGLALRDWSISGDCPSQSWLKVDMESDVANISGQRALAWLENNLLSDLRIPFIPMFTRFQLPDGSWTEHQPTRRGELAQYGEYYRPGMIKPCPFTGVCFDEDFIEALVKAVKDGDTLEDAYRGLAQVAGKLFEQEIEQAQSEETFLEQDHLLYTFEGKFVEVKS
jgi:hypothetical protein